MRLLLMLALRGLAKGSQAIAFIFLARGLSPEGFGTYSTVTTAIFLVGTIGNLGLRQSSAYMVGQKMLSPGQAVFLLSSVFPLFFLFSAAVIFSLYWDLLKQSSIWIELSVAGAIFVVLYTSLLQGILLGTEALSEFALSDTIPRIALSILAGSLYFSGHIEIESAFFIFFLSFALGVPYSISRALKGSKFEVTSLGKLPIMIKHGAVFALSMFFVSLNARIGLLVVQDRMGPKASGFFFAGQRLSEVFLELATVAGLIVFSKAVKTGRSSDAIAKAAQSTSQLFWLFIAFTVPLLIFSEDAVKILLGNEYAEATAVIRIVCIGLAPAAVVKILNGAVTGSGKPYLSASVAGVGILVNVSTTHLLFPSFLEGAASMGLVVSQYFTAILYIVICRIKYETPVKSFFLIKFKK